MMTNSKLIEGFSELLVSILVSWLYAYRSDETEESVGLSEQPAYSEIEGKTLETERGKTGRQS